MEFSRLKLSGFKSFCDQVELPIGEGLTGIVGPNGCGKSNVVEAMRWVMGESSARDLRGSEMDDVLFGGSSLRPAYDIAEVALLVENAGPQTDAEGATNSVVAISEARAGQWGGTLEVSRRLARGSGSTYRINGREARARDVQLIFADAAAGSRSPAIISQGRVTSIIEAKPEERRRLLEDAAGIGGLHSRRREAELKLRATEANLERVGDRLASLDADLAGLRQQAKQAERFRSLSEDISELEKLVLLAELAAAQKRLEKAVSRDDRCQEELVRAQSTLQDAAALVATLAEQLPPLHGEVNTLTAELAKGGERLRAMRQQAEAQRREVRRVADELDQAQSAVAKASGELEASKRADTIARHALDQAVSEQKTVTQAHEMAVAEEARLATAAKAARDQLEQQRLAVAERESRQRETTSMTARLDQRRQAIQTELARAGEIDDEALVTVAARQLQVARREHAEAADALKTVQHDFATARDAAERARRELDDVRERATSTQTLLQEARAEQVQHEAACKRFEEQQGALTEREERLRVRLERVQTSLAAIDLSEAVSASERVGQAVVELTCARDDATAHVATSANELSALETKLLETKEHASNSRRAHERLTAEADALRGLQQNDSTTPIVDSLRIEDGWSTALASALGDDLLFGRTDDEGCYWREVEPGLLPSWPASLDTLDTFVTGEPLLAARLALVGICESAEQAASLQSSLSPGQRLVTRDGGLWRWDGLVKLPEAGSLAEQRVAQRRRLTEIERQLPDAEQCVADASTQVATMEAAITAARLSAEEARRQETIAERKLNDARHDQESKARRLLDLRDQAQRLEAEQAELESENRALTDERAALVPPTEKTAELDQHVATLTAHADQAEGALTTSRHASEATADALSQLEANAAKARDLEAGKAQALAQAENLFERRQGEAQGRKQSRQIAVEGMQRELQEIDVERTACAARISEDESKLAAARSCLAKLTQSETETAAAFAQARSHLAEQEATRHRLDERVPTLRSQIEKLETDQKRSAENLDQVKARLHRLGMTQEALDLHVDGPSDAVIAEKAEALAKQQTRLDELKSTLARVENEHTTAVESKDAASERNVSAREAAATSAAAREQADAELETLAESAKRGLGTSPDPLLDEPSIQEALAEHSVRQLEAKLDALKLRRERMGPVNLRAAIEIEERAKQLDEQRAEADDLTEAVARLQAAIADLDREARQRLQTAFDKVDGHFRRLFVQLFGGGKAHLRLTNIDVPGRAGLELDAMPPGKKLQNISLLSGGEKGLTALAMVFALFLSQPSPLCVLDEVDAALDDANVERFVGLMQEIARQTGTRFIVVTHHPLTMARMDRLFGVTMVERGVSRLVSVALSAAIELRSTA